MKKTMIQKMFWAAGLINIIGMLSVSLFFTSPYPAKYYPLVFSNFGMIVIMLWGLANIAVSSVYMHVRMLLFVFALERMAYTITWIIFIATSGSLIPVIFQESIITGLILGSYGLCDAAFSLFFTWVGLKGYRISE
ncbi:MAG TPA: hypothetical protein PK544_13055 [Spirochaetota bacterium]|nr:hypothetical protein [Spirochaetota bacterium]